MSLETFVRKVHPLARCMVSPLDDFPHPADVLTDVRRYLNCGPDEGALRVLATDPPTMKGYLYIVHEVVEISPLLIYLNAAKPTRGFKRSDGTLASTPVADLWKYNFDHNTTFKQAVHPADHAARRIESQAEKALVRLLFGEDIPLNAFVWTIETKPGAVSGWEDETIRGKVAALLGDLAPPSIDDANRARDYRQRLWALGLHDVVARCGGIPELPFGLWQARGCPPNDDLRDWYAAEEFQR